jgi:hypothetical protein
MLPSLKNGFMLLIWYILRARVLCEVAEQRANWDYREVLSGEVYESQNALGSDMVI